MRCGGWSIVAWLWRARGDRMGLTPCVKQPARSWPLEDCEHRVEAALSRVTGSGLPDGRETLTHDEALDGDCSVRRTGSRFWKADRRIPVAFAESGGRHGLAERFGRDQVAVGWLAGPHQREERRLHRPRYRLHVS